MSIKKNRKFIILGAGLSGLEFGRKLKSLEYDFVILEKEKKIGGLARTNKTGRFSWDFGVHALYSKDSKTAEYLKSLPINMSNIKRNVKVFHITGEKVYLLDYPFELGVKDLPAFAKLECMFGYLVATLKPKKKLVSLEDWIDKYCGYGIAKHFMVPYNNKIWSCNLSEISTDLVNLKIEPASFYDFFLSALGKKVVGRAHQADFFYPKQGVQSFINHTARNIKNNIVLSQDVEKLERNNNLWEVATKDGKKYVGTDIVSTIPLPELITKANLKSGNELIKKFRWNNTYFILVGLKNGQRFNYINDCQWIFFKGKEIFYRLSMMHTFSKKFPTSLIAEITKKDIINNMSQTEIVDRVVDDLVGLKILDSKNQIAVTDIKLVEHTYPIPTIGLSESKLDIHEEAKKLRLHLLGRNGNWDYINMDGVLKAVETLTEELNL